MFGTLISSVTVGAGGAASITFSSIPATYTDLTIVLSPRSDQSASNVSFLTMRFNSDTASNYTWRQLLGDGGTTASASGSSQTYIRCGYFPAAGSTASTMGNLQVIIPNYAGSSAKTVATETVSENNTGGSGSAYQNITAGLWSGTAAISSIILYAANYDMTSTYNFTQYSTAYLYGTLKGSGGATVA